MKPVEWIRRLLRPGKELQQRAITGGVWAMLINVSSRGLSLVRLVVLAVFLSPEQFGLFGIALLALAVLQSVSHLGLDRALIQREENIVDEFLDTVLGLRVARGGIIFFVGYVIAPLVAEFYGEPAVTSLIRVLSATVLLRGLRNPGAVYFDKDLNLHYKFVQKISGAFANTVVAVAVAVATGSVWALVVGQLVGSGVSTGVSYLIHEYRPRLSFEFARARELVKFGKWITGSAVLALLTTMADDALVGWLLGATALGYYQLAFRLANAPATEIADTLSTALRPTYSKLQSNPDKLREWFLRAMRVVSVIALPMALGILVTARPFIFGILGSTWEPAIPLMEVFALVAAFRAILTPFAALNEARGRPDISTKTQAAGVAVMLLLLYPAANQYGIVGVAVATGARFFVFIPVVCYVARWHVEIPIQQLATVLSGPLLASSVMAVFVVAVQSLMTFPPLLELVVSIAVGVLLYVPLLLAFDRVFDSGVRTEIQQFKKNTIQKQ